MDQAKQLRDALELCESYCARRSWQEAWAVLELRPYLEVMRLPLNILVGLEDWQKAQILALSLCAASGRNKRQRGIDGPRSLPTTAACI